MENATFHEGERAVQQRVGVAERLAAIGPQVIRGYMPEQHSAFFEQLPFVIAGSVDAQGRPWASVLAHPPGFIESLNPQRLAIHALPGAHDPLARNLANGAAIGLLGIEPHTRRRNRMNGIVRGLGHEGFEVEVSQSFGNCPKYIQARKPEYVGEPAATQLFEAPALDDAARRIIRAADTFFIATAHPHQDPALPAHGVDVSHRGGKPGFVRVDEDGTLTAPDFTGNFFFNTLGNIAVNPRAGLLFIDFDSGELLYLAVLAEIIWQGAELDAFEGAQRLLRFRVSAMRRATAALPLRFGPAQLSPVLGATGQWPPDS